jgi:xanthine phosphoribosyltransferase
MSEKYTVTWNTLHTYSRRLASHLFKLRKWEGLVAVSRGGLVPASLIARELCIRYVDTVCISSYDDRNNQNKMKVLKCPKGDGDGLIIIDDLVDTGNTARAIRKLYPKAYLVCIFAKPSSRHLVDRYVVDVPQDIWIEQPWDTGLVYLSPLVKDE